MCSPMSANAMISSRFAAISRGGEAEQRRGEVDVREPRVLGMEARAQLEQRADAAADGDACRAWAGSRRRRSSAASTCRRRSRRSRPATRRAAARSSRRRARGTRAPRRARAAGPRPGARGRRARRPSRSPCRRRRGAAATRLAVRRHRKSSKCGDSRRNTQRPAKNSASATASATASPHCSASRPSSSASRRRVDEPAERIGRDPRPHAFGHQRQRIEDRRQVHQDHQHRHQHVLDVADEHLQRREEQRDARSPRSRARATAARRAAAPRSGRARRTRASDDEHGEVARELQRERRRDRRVDDELVRKRDLADQPGVAGEADRRALQRLPARRATATARRRRTAGSSCRRSSPARNTVVNTKW